MGLLLFLCGSLYTIDSGKKWYMIYLLANLFFICSESFLLIFIIFLGKGWQLTRRKISRQGRMKIAIYWSFILWIGFLNILWNYLDGSSTYREDIFISPFYEMLIILRVVIIIWFIYAFRTTYHKSTRKVHFYRKFLLFILTWFLYQLLVTILIDYSKSAYRASIYYFLYFFSILYIQTVLSIMFFPCRLTNGFPYHQVMFQLSISDQSKVSSSIKANQAVDMTKWLLNKSLRLYVLSKELSKIFDNTFRHPNNFRNFKKLGQPSTYLNRDETVQPPPNSRSDFLKTSNLQTKSQSPKISPQDTKSAKSSIINPPEQLQNGRTTRNVPTDFFVPAPRKTSFINQNIPVNNNEPHSNPNNNYNLFNNQLKVAQMNNKMDLNISDIDDDHHHHHHQQLGDNRNLKPTSNLGESKVNQKYFPPTFLKPPSLLMRDTPVSGRDTKQSITPNIIIDGINELSSMANPSQVRPPLRLQKLRAPYPRPRAIN